jgi:hypothetical protein
LGVPATETFLETIGGEPFWEKQGQAEPYHRLRSRPHAAFWWKSDPFEGRVRTTKTQLLQCALARLLEITNQNITGVSSR